MLSKINDTTTPNGEVPYQQNLIKKNLKTLWPLFMDGVQLPHSHFEEAVYYLPFSSQIPGTHFIDLGRMKG